jgi:hypothetical protein
MTKLIEVGGVLKSDTVGRVQTPPERRESLLDEFERSGLSGPKFAKLAGLKYQTFAAWVARRRKQRGDIQPAVKTADPVRWLETVVAEAKAPTTHGLAPVRIQLSAAAWIELSDLTQIDLVAALVHALEKSLPTC